MLNQEIEQLARLLAWRELALRYLDLTYSISEESDSYFYLEDYNRMQVTACILDYDVLHPRVKLYDDARNFVNIAVGFTRCVETEDEGEAAEFIENWFKIN